MKELNNFLKGVILVAPVALAAFYFLYYKWNLSLDWTASIAILGIGIYVVVGLFNRRRHSKGLEQVAQDLRLRFFPEGDPAMAERYVRTSDSKYLNMMHGEIDGIEIVFCEKRHFIDTGWTSGDRHGPPIFKKVTSAIIDLPAHSLDLPKFHLRLRHWVPRFLCGTLNIAFSTADIVFPSHPKFSKTYALNWGTGSGNEYEVNWGTDSENEDEESIRSFFGKELLDFIENWKRVEVLNGEVYGLRFYLHGMELMAEGDRLRLLLRENARINPRDVERCMMKGIKLFKLLRDRNAAGG